MWKIAESARKGIFMSESTNVFTPEDIEKNKVIAALAYLVFFIPLLAAPESKFGRYHANQGLVLNIAEIILSVFSSIFLYSIPFIGWAISLVLNLVMLFLVISGFMNAYNGKAVPLPVVGGITILK